MRLRDEVHRSIDALDDRSLALVYEHVQILLQAKQEPAAPIPVPSIEEVLKLTSCVPGEWDSDITAEREDRL